MPEIKFCGLTRAEDAEWAAELGVEYAGLVLAPSPRQVTLAQGRAIVAALGGAAQPVGVFVAPDAEWLPRAVDALGLAAVQVHGALAGAAVKGLRRTCPGVAIWTVRRVSDGGVERAHAEVDSDVILLDTYSPTASGGTGQSFDWTRAQAAVAALRGTSRVGVAGGLQPGNVQAAIEALAPDLVDVSSGIESAPGLKDHRRMSEFVAAVRGHRRA